MLSRVIPGSPLPVRSPVFADTLNCFPYLNQISVGVLGASGGELGGVLGASGGGLGGRAEHHVKEVVAGWSCVRAECFVGMGRCVSLPLGPRNLGFNI